MARSLHLAIFVMFTLPSISLVAFDQRDLRKVQGGERNLEHFDLSDAQLSGINLAKDSGGGVANLYYTVFNNTGLESADITGARAHGAKFIGAKLQHLTATNTDFTEAVFSDPDETDVARAKKSAARVRDANFDGAKFKEAYVKYVDFSSIRSATGADFSKAKGLTSKQATFLLDKGAINVPKFRRASDITLIMRGRNMPEASIEGAELQGMDLSSRQLPKAHANNVILDGTLAYRLNFQEAEATDASFVGVNFTHATLDGIQAWGANFSQAVLWGATVEGAILAGANFDGANVIGVDFTRAHNVTGADFRKAVGLSEEQAQHLKDHNAQVTLGGYMRRLRRGSVSTASQRPPSIISSRPRSQTGPPAPPPRTTPSTSPESSPEREPERLSRQVPAQLQRRGRRPESMRTTRVVGGDDLSQRKTQLMDPVVVELPSAKPVRIEER